MADGSITFSTALDNEQLEKDLAGLTKKIEKKERDIADLELKLAEAKKKGLADVKTLDREKAALKEIKDKLAEIRAASKDKSLRPWDREEAKAQVPAVQEELKEQQARVSALQTEWNKTENAAERYAAQLTDAQSVLERQKKQAGELLRELNEAAQQKGPANAAAEQIKTLKAELKNLESQGKWFGDKDYDEVFQQWAKINEEVKEYKKNLTEAAKEAASLPEGLEGAAAGGAEYRNADEEYFANVSKQAQATAERIDELKGRLDDLKGRQSDLGLAFGKKARAEFEDLDDEIAEVTQRIENCQQYLDGLAESGELSQLANGAEIAERRLESLEDELAGLQERQQRLGLAFGAKDEYAALSSEIQRITGLMERYKAVAGEGAAGETVIDEVSKDAEVANQHVVDLCEELETLKARLKELEGEGIGLGYQEYDDAVARIAEINEELKEYKRSLSDVETQADRVSQANSRISAVMSKLSSMMQNSNSAALQGMGAALGAIAPKAALALGALKQLKTIADHAFGKMLEQMRSFLGGVGKGAAVLKNFSKAAVKAFAMAVRGIVELLDRVNVFPKMFSSIGKSLAKLGQMIRRVFVFSVITAGLRMVRTQMAAYLGVNAQFTTALRQLKGVLLTAFQPIYDVVVPALVTLMNILSRVIAAVAQFTAVLFGTTAKQAQQNAKDLYAQANATTAAGDAAEEAALQMASFDEINKLEGNKSSGGGGGAVDTGPLFDWEYEDTPFPDWGEAFSAFLDKILDNIPKLRDAFKNFADWLNEWSKKVYDMFTFPGVLDKVKQIGHDLAEAFNDLVNWIDWYQLGQALGAGLNLALNFLTSFLYTFDWMNLGHSLAELINGLASEIDWYEFGRLLWSGFKIGLETLAGFLLGLDMPLIAQAAGNIVIGFFAEMKNTIQRIPWYEIGTQIAEFLVNLDWYGMLSSVTSAVAAGLMAAVAAVHGFLDRIVPELDRIAGEIVQALIEFFRDEVEWDKLAQTIGDGIAAALRFAAGLLDPELFYEIGSSIGEFLINLEWVEMFDGLAEALANGINSAIALVRGILDQLTPEKLKEIADGIAQKINEFVETVDWAELGRTISGGIEAALNFMIELMDQIDWEAVGTAICTFLENIDWETLLSNWGTLMGQFIDAKLKAMDLSGMLDVGMQIVAGLAQGMLNKFNESGGILGWLKSLLVDPILDGVKGLFGIHSPSTVFAEIGGLLIEGLKNGVSETWHTITDFFGEKLDALKLNLSETWDNVKTTASEKWGNIKTALGDAWDNIKTAAGEKFGEVKQNIIDKMGELKDHDWNGIGSTIMNGVWDGLKSIWSSITTWASGLGSKLSSALSGAKNAVSSIMNSRASVSTSRISVQSMPDISSYQIPALAKGAVIPPNREFLAVLGDQRRGTNIEAPVSEIEGAVARGIRAAGGAGGNRPITVVLQLDRRELGRVVYEVNNEETQRVGVRLAEVRG